MGTNGQTILELSELKVGVQSDFFAVLAEKTVQKTREGKPFAKMRFRDRLKSYPCIIWNDSELFEKFEKDWQAGCHMKVRGKLVDNPRYGKQIEIELAREVKQEDWVAGYNPDKFVMTSRFPVDEMFAELLSHIEQISDAPLRKLVQLLVKKHEAEIKRIPAATKNHHAFKGGYLEHTLSVVRTGAYFADKYSAYYPDLDPPLDKDLVLAGCVLHDIGKIYELPSDDEKIEYSTVGNMIGHILIGRDMVREAAGEIATLHPDRLLLLEHIILSHQGTPEWGSPRPPMIPEAFLVHMADDTDAKMAMFVQAITTSEEAGPFTERSRVLQRKLMKERGY